MKARRSIWIIATLVTTVSLGFLFGFDGEREPLLAANVGTDESVIFRDSELEEVVRVFVEKPAGDIYPSELEALPIFVIPPNVSDLTGLEYCTSLREVFVRSSQIDDYSPLATLPNLTGLHGIESHICDLAPFASLTNLSLLDLPKNKIVDISPLANLTGLNWLNLAANRINDITPLSDLVGLTALNLAGNQVTDISPLWNLRNLRYLDLTNNGISDLLPLVENSGLGNGMIVRIDGNPLSNRSFDVHIPQLEARGVEVSWQHQSAFPLGPRHLYE